MSLFTKILYDVTNFDTYFMHRKNATRKLGASPHQKMTLVMRMLAYGIPADAADEYSRLGESNIIESFHHFIRAIPQIYGATYLRSPTKDDLTRLLHKANQRGFPDLTMGSLESGCHPFHFSRLPVQNVDEFDVTVVMQWPTAFSCLQIVIFEPIFYSKWRPRESGHHPLYSGRFPIQKLAESKATDEKTDIITRNS
ncbi:hypothetical protein QYF36_003554 [Acer negundo]|nr:hypothetical protein QYF36_003554 [Acer negundo]